MPLHVAAQLESPDRRRDLLPALGERRHDLHLLAAPHERLVDLAVDRVVDDLVLAVGIGAGVVGEARPAQRGRGGGGSG